MRVEKFILPEVDLTVDSDAASWVDFSIWRNLEYIGELLVKDGQEIVSSPIGIGYETLDRDTFDPKPTYPLMARAGVKWARVQTGWNKTEKAKGVYGFTWLDDIVDSLLSHGITPWFSVSFGNKLYTVTEKHLMEYVGEVPLYYGEEAVTGWRRYVYALAVHYKARVKHWEIWNEPNTPAFWRPKPNPEDYVELVRISAEEIKRVISDARIIGGALSGCDTDFLYQALKAGLGNIMDILSVHPYSLLPELTLEQDMKVVRRYLREFNCEIPIWQGECGHPSGGKSRRGVRLSEYTQAQYLLRRIITDLGMGFEMTSYFSVSDYENYMQKGRTHHMGVIRAGTPKLSYYVFKCLCRLFDSKTKPVEHVLRCFPLRKPYLRSLLPYLATRVHTFERKNIPMLVYWVPEQLDLDIEPLWCEIQTCGDAQRKPILIDPLQRKVYKLPHWKSFSENKINIEVPLLNYPLIISDIELLDTL